MADLTVNQKRDYQKYFIEGGEKGFNPAYNEKIVNDCIAKHDKYIELKKKIYYENVRERSDAVISYLKHLDRKKTTPVEKYFSKKELARLRGEQIKYTVRNNAKYFITS